AATNQRAESEICCTTLQSDASPFVVPPLGGGERVEPAAAEGIATEDTEFTERREEPPEGGTTNGAAEEAEGANAPPVGGTKDARHEGEDARTMEEELDWLRKRFSREDDPKDDALAGDPTARLSLRQTR